jgi:hypothetical protein
MLDEFKRVNLWALSFMLPILLRFWHLNYGAYTCPHEPYIEKQKLLDFSIILSAYISIWRLGIMQVKSQPQNEFFG